MEKINRFFITSSLLIIVIIGLLIIILFKLNDSDKLASKDKKYSESISICTAQAQKEAIDKNNQEAADRAGSPSSDFQKSILSKVQDKFSKEDYDFYYTLCMRTKGYDK